MTDRQRQRAEQRKRLQDTRGLDWSDNPQFKKYARHFREDVLPRITDSALFVAIGSDQLDIKFVTEIGAALVLDKPFLLVVPPGRHVSARLRRAADVVVDDYDQSPAAQHRVLLAIQELTGEKPPPDN